MNSIRRFFGRCIVLIGVFLSIFGVGGFIECIPSVYDHEFLLFFALVAISGVLIVMWGSKLFKSGSDSHSSKPRKTTVEQKNPSTETTVRPPEPPKPPEPPAAPTKMVCPSCGKEYPLDDVYCDECGSRLKET